MNLAAYDALIDRLEAENAADSLTYRTKVRALVGFGYLAAVIIALVGLSLVGAAIAVVVWDANAGTAKIGFIAGGFGLMLTWSVVRTMLIRVRPPDGYRLKRDECSELWDEVDRLTERLAAPRISRIYLDANLNAALIQSRIFGLFGPSRAWLLLGLPLMRTLSQDELRTVIAHELGHARRDHGGFGARVYRIRLLWAALMERMGDSGKGLVARFLRWYAPFFNAYTFVMARHQEREADQAATEACSSESAARALVRVSILAHQANEGFWEVLPRRACRESEPPQNLIGEFQRVLAVRHPAAGRWLSETLARPNTREDTHPCVRERLEIMGVPIGRFRIPPTPVPPGQTAAKALLGADEARIAEALNEHWRQTIAETWSDQHTYGQHQAERRKDLEARGDALSRDERWELIQIIDLLDGHEATRGHLERLLLDNPQDPAVCFWLGRLYINSRKDEDTGAALLLRAMELDRDAIIPASALLSDWHARHGREEESRTWDRHAYDRSTIETKAAEERSVVPKAKQLRPHGCTDQQLGGLRSALAGFDKVQRADLAAVACVHLPERPYHLLVVHLKHPWYKPVAEDEDAALLQSIAQGLGWTGAILVISHRGTHAKLAKKVAKQKDARVYQR